jgi:tRNA threonylcarbamoyladenosine biosynthesis protein TsaB
MNDSDASLKALALESASSRLEIAALNNGETVCFSLDCGLHMAERLIPALEDVLRKAGLKPQDLDFIAINKGPGSFTSLRLGFSLAKGLSLAAGCPIYGIPGMQVYAWPFRLFKAPVIPSVDAKRRKFYASVFRQGKEVIAGGDYGPEEIAAFLDPEEPALLAGPDAELLKEALWSVRPGAQFFSVDSPVFTAQALFALAEIRRNEGSPPLGDFEGPLYIRLSEAEESYNQEGAAPVAALPGCVINLPDVFSPLEQ